MSIFSLRPTFEIPLAEERQPAIDKLAAEFTRSQQLGFLMHGEYGELHLQAAEHRLWSPHLSFYVSQRGEQTLIHGRFARVWKFGPLCGSSTSRCHSPHFLDWP